jgi:Dolichyl-phosphate-mannose-protein mannosyltransferase
MASTSARSTIIPVSARSTTLAQRASEYFGMSGPPELIAAATLFALMVVVKLVNITRYRFDSDESQHMHVIWAWARGLIQYRDVFDNHMPLFQIMFAPIFGVIGDRATILYWMRFILLPMYFVGAWCTYRIGTLLFSRRAGIWAVLLAGTYTGYHFISFEFRTDNLWAPLWLMCLTVLIGGAITVRRALVAGLLLGFCFGVSMKSTLLLVSILVAAPIALFLVGRQRLGQSWPHLVRCAATFLGATVLVPGAIMIFFALKGVWSDFRYCNFDHNILPNLNVKNHPAWWIIIFPVVFPMVIYAARLIVRATPQPAIAFRRAFIFLIGGFYGPALYSFWNLITRQDYLPYDPIAFVIYSGALLAISQRFTRSELGVSQILRRCPLTVFIAALGLFLTVVTRPFWRDRAKIETNLLRAILTLTEPGDYVIDCKGETIFRQRCFRPVMEAVTMERFLRKLMVDDSPQKCIDTRTCVAAMMGGMSFYAGKFVHENYIPVGDEVRVVGRYLKPSSPDNSRIDFEVVIPASYKIIADGGPVTGSLDGTPYDGARFLEAGKHTFVPTAPAGELVLLWARAVDHNYTPFHNRSSSPGG